MRLKLAVPLAFALLAGCGQSEGEKAEAELDLVLSGFPSPDEVCGAKRRVEQGYLRDGNKEKYQRWRVNASLACNQADLDRLMRQ